MPMKNPPHPGKVVRVSCLEPLGLSVTEGAKALGVSRQALSNLVNGRAQDVVRDGDSPRQGLRLHDRDLDTPSDGLRHRPGT